MLIRALRNLVPVLPIPVTLDFGVDWRVTGFALVISICAAFMFGLPPAIQAARVDLASATRSDRVAGEAPKRLRLRQAFVIAQIAFSVLLVVCASLLVRSARTAASTNPGFDVANVDLIEVDLGLAGYDDRSGADLAQKILSEVAQLPGVVSAATTWIVPLQLRATATTVSVPRSGADTLTVTTLWNAVSPGYFETLGLPLVRGRSFSDADRPESQNVAVINETLARRAWPGEDALGKILSDGSEPPMEVIGIARDSKYRTIGEPSQPILYRPLSQRHQNQLSLLVRKDGGSLLPDLQLLLRRIDANLPILRASTLEEAAGFSLFPGRLAMWTAAGSAGIGVFLAILGLYGITAYDVTRRTREIGIRLAVGARPSQVMRMVVHRAMRVASMGTLLGLLGAVGLSRILRAILFGVDPLDPLSFASGAAVCILVALAASLVPARRAAGADAVAALRVD
jgi:predicted permease